ncbi:polysaccharide deacetylase family protein [Candidatus Altiarchaeota archaeon]
MMKKVTLFFDFEAAGRKSFPEKFGLEQLMAGLVAILEKHEARAVFNTTGKVVENFPKIVADLHSKGHEIACHGYDHENFGLLDAAGLDKVLEKTEKLILGVTGKKPSGIRCPWLASSDTVIEVISGRDYDWLSNEYLLFPERWVAPASFSTANGWVRDKLPLYRRLWQKIRFDIKWSSYPKGPHIIRPGLTSIPLLSSMDGDLLFYLPPSQESPGQWLDYAFKSWVKQYKRSGEHFNLNLHPWLIGSANRLELLDRIMDFIVCDGVEFVQGRDLALK